MRVIEVMLACNVEQGYRVVALEDGRYAFVRGNVRARVGDTLPQENELRKGQDVDVYDRYEDCLLAWHLQAAALHRTGGKFASAEMMAVLES